VGRIFDSLLAQGWILEIDPAQPVKNIALIGARNHGVLSMRDHIRRTVGVDVAGKRSD
jgi:hypothetical protein